MISHELRCMMVHVRKSGGTSIKHLILDSTKENENNLFNNGALDPGYQALIRRFPHYYRFAVVRDPYSRFFSAWKYLSSTRNSEPSAVLRNLPSKHLVSSALRFGTSLSLRSAYLKEFVRIARYHALNKDFLHLLGHDYRHISVPQANFIFDSAKGSCVVHDVFRLEDIVVNPTPLLRRIGLSLEKQLPHKNANAGSPVSFDCLDAGACALVRQYFGCDFERFGYQK